MVGTTSNFYHHQVVILTFNPLKSGCILATDTFAIILQSQTSAAKKARIGDVSILAIRFVGESELRARACLPRVGIPYSPATGLPTESQTVSQMVDKLTALPDGERIYLLAPVVRDRKGEYRKEIAEWQKAGLTVTLSEIELRQK
jgi:excinuclease UvrABC ATPase subunit